MKKARLFVDKLYPDNSLLKSFIKGSFWAVYGNVIAKGASLVASVFIARLLGSGSFGELSIIKTTLSVFSLFATFGLGVTLTKFIAESKKKGEAQVRTVISAANVITIFTGATLGLLIILFAPFISTSILHAENLVNPLRISGVYLFFNALTVCQVGVISGLEGFRDLARINLIIGVITFPVLVVCTYFLGLNGAMLGLTINLIVNWYLNKSLIDKKIGPAVEKMSFVRLKGEVGAILKFSYLLALKEIIYSFSNWACFYLLLTMSNYEQVGIFNSANQLSQLILFLPASILNVFLSHLTNQADDRSNYNQLVRKNILFTVIITVAVGAVIILLADLIYRFYGNTFVGGAQILYILVAATLPMSLVGIFEQICISSSKPGLVTAFQFVIQFFILTAAILFFSIDNSATSLAFAFLAGYCISSLIMYIYIKKIGLI